MGWKKISVLSCFVAVLSVLAYYYLNNSFFVKVKTDGKNNESETKLNFVTEWHDNVSGLIRKFQLTYFTSDSSVEMYDLIGKRLFLKRYVGADVSPKDLYIGNTVVILARQLSIVDYSDEKTKEIITRNREKTFAMIKPDAVHRVGEIVDMIQNRNFQIAQMKMTHLTKEQATQFYVEHKNRDFFKPFLAFITGGNVIAMELIRNEAVKSWRETIGPTFTAVAKVEAPESVRAKFGTDKTANAVHGSDSTTSASRELSFFFGKNSSIKSSASFGSSTCCIVKPHAIKTGHLGAILRAFHNENLDISALQMFRLNKKQAEELHEVYDEVVSEYPGMVQELISGPCVAFEVSGDKDIVKKVREFVGPRDPTRAKELRPHSPRAKFGLNKIQNAIHCTDLPEDGKLEVEYFFKILQQ